MPVPGMIGDDVQIVKPTTASAAKGRVSSACDWMESLSLASGVENLALSVNLI